MIKLQSSMSKHIPVSNVFSVAAILCPLSFPLGLCCKKKKKIRTLSLPAGLHVSSVKITALLVTKPVYFLRVSDG